MSEISEWAIVIWASAMLGMSWHIGRKLDEIADLLRKRR